MAFRKIVTCTRNVYYVSHCDLGINEGQGHATLAFQIHRKYGNPLSRAPRGGLQVSYPGPSVSITPHPSCIITPCWCSRHTPWPRPIKSISIAGCRFPFNTPVVVQSITPLLSLHPPSGRCSLVASPLPYLFSPTLGLPLKVTGFTRQCPPTRKACLRISFKYTSSSQ